MNTKTNPKNWNGVCTTRKSRRLSALQATRSPAPSANSHVSSASSCNSACDSTDSFLDNFISSRKEIIQKQRPQSQAYAASRSVPTARQTGNSEDDANAEQLSSKTLWEMRISSLPKDFFTSRESKLLVNATNNRSKQPLCYRALFMDDTVLADLRAFYQNQVEPHICRSQSIVSYKQLKTTLGQLARYACAVGRFSAFEYHNPGGLFSLSRDEKMIRAFILGMQTRCSATTIATKAALVLKWVQFSSLYYAKTEKRGCSALCEVSAEYLRTTAAAEKRESRRLTRTEKNPLSRLQSNKMLLQEDYERAQERSEAKLRGLLQTLTSDMISNRANSRSSREEAAFQFFTQKKGSLLRKWCINFLTLVVMHAGGQRAQVFAELELTAFGINANGSLVQTMDEVEECAHRTGYFYLQAKFEKRARSSRMPFIRMPLSTLDIYIAHRNLAVPSILRKGGKSSTEFLLLNSESGESLTARQICTTVKSFFTEMDPEIGTITPLIIRRSYASFMYHRFLRGEIFSGKTRAEFLDYLAERMNTSTEQLEEAYCADESVERMVSRIFHAE